MIPQGTPESAGTRKPGAWLDFLSDEDAAFLKRFILASGSLKELAQVYGVSYPTIRLRVDRLIQKIQVIEAHDDADPFERQLRGLLAEGKLDNATFREIFIAYRRNKLGDHAAP
jgi:hypothetical protein